MSFRTGRVPQPRMELLRRTSPSREPYIASTSRSALSNRPFIWPGVYNLIDIRLCSVCPPRSTIRSDSTRCVLGSHRFLTVRSRMVRLAAKCLNMASRLGWSINSRPPGRRAASQSCTRSGAPCCDDGDVGPGFCAFLLSMLHKQCSSCKPLASHSRRMSVIRFC